MQRSPDSNEDPMDFGPSGAEGIDIGLLVKRAVIRHGASIGLMTLIGLAGGVFAAVIRPNLYESEAKLQVRLGAREQRTPEGAITDEFQRMGSNIAIGDVMHVFTDPMLHLRVAEIVGVESILAPADPTMSDDETTSLPIRWMHELQSWWYQRAVGDARPETSAARLPSAYLAQKILETGIVIASSPLDSTIIVRYTSPSPDRAQEIAQVYLEVLRARHREVYESASQLSFLERQLTKAVDDKATLATQLEEKRQEFSIIDIAAEITSLSEGVDALVDLIESEEAELAAALAQLDQLDTDYADIEPTIAREPTRTLIVNADYSSLIEQQRETLRLIDEVGSQYPIGSVGYEARTASLKKQLERIETDLEDNDRFVQMGDDSPVVVENRTYYDIANTRLSLQQQIGALEARIEKRKEFKTQQITRRDELVALEPEYQELEAELTRRETRIDALRPAYERAVLLQDVGQEESLSNLKVIQTPTRPLTKIGPNRKKYVLLGLLAGLGLGLGSAVLRRLLDTKIRYPDEIEQWAGVPALGTVPETAKWRRWGHAIRGRAGR